VLLDDLDPFRMPASDGQPTGRLTEPQVAHYTAALRDGWETLNPARAAEIAALIRVIVPYQAPPGGLVSTTSPETFGTVAMSLPPDRYSCGEILIHETQHVKLCALLDLVTLTLPDEGQRYYAPWRPDPRPASGLIQGTYAFLGVAGFWREQWLAASEPDIRCRAERDFARWRDAAALGAETLLASGQLTSAGMIFAAEMAGVLADWQHEPVSDEALALARRKADQHRARWLADNAGTSESAAAPG
jgi:HEXXH motif-containing protein